MGTDRCMELVKSPVRQAVNRRFFNRHVQSSRLKNVVSESSFDPKEDPLWIDVMV